MRKRGDKMKIRYLLPAFASVAVLMLYYAQPVWTADSLAQPRSLNKNYCKPKAEVYGAGYDRPDDYYPSRYAAEHANAPDEVRSASYNICSEDNCSSMCENLQPCPQVEGCGVGNGCCPEASCCGCLCVRKEIFAEYLYLRPLNAGVEYAVPFNGPISGFPTSLQEGRTASVNPDFSSGFRAGGALWLDDCTAIAVTFSHYENNADDSISVLPPLVLRSMVMHPSSFDADADWLDARAHQYIRFELADLDYRHEFYSSECSLIDYVVGIRYANLRQEFDSQFDEFITGTVNTNVNFDGGGLRLGLEAERYGTRGISVYGKAAASFLGGEFRGTYLQADTNLPVVTQTAWKEARFVSILDCEVGVHWTSCNRRVRASAGYMVSGWMNVVKTGEFISSVQANKYHGPDKINGNGLVFDGLVARLEYNW
jgi:hypothetical protein